MLRGAVRRSTGLSLRVLAGCALFAAAASPSAAWAAPGGGAERRGLQAAKKGDCVTAVPLLEEAELERHRPSVALALAECYVATGELLRASEVLRALEAEAAAPPKQLSPDDRKALGAAAARADEIDARIPTVRFEPEVPYAALEIEVAGRLLDKPEQPVRLAPDEAVTVVLRARAHLPLTVKLTLAESERKVHRFRLQPARTPPPSEPTDPLPPYWLGARYDGAVMPQLFLQPFWEGGTTLVLPGAAATFTLRARDADLVFSLGYLGTSMPDTPFLPRGAPVTDWEIMAFDAHAVTLGFDLLYRVKLDPAERGAFRVGASLGGGVIVEGALRRTQAYPTQAADGSIQLTKCLGPNAPAGTFRYCNELDADADHYGDYREPSFFDGGSYPLAFPLFALPMLGFTYRPGQAFALDVDVAFSLTGLRTTAGFRFGL